MRTSTKRWAGLVVAVSLASGWQARVGAQPNEPPPPPQGGRPEGGPPEHRPPPDPLREALDRNGDRALDADEIRLAPASLAALDANGDGRIDHEEFRPPLRHPGGGQPEMPALGDRQPPGPGGRDPRGAAEQRRGPADRFRGGSEQRRGPPGAGDRGGPSPERFVERALRCDADGDGRLDRQELETLAAEFLQRRPGGEGGSRSPEGPPRGPERRPPPPGVPPDGTRSPGE